MVVLLFIEWRGTGIVLRVQFGGRIHSQGFSACVHPSGQAGSTALASCRRIGSSASFASLRSVAVEVIPPLVHDRHLIAEAGDDADIVGDEEIGDAGLLLQPAQQSQAVFSLVTC